MAQHFEVSASWMKACGHGEHVATFPIVWVQRDNGIAGDFFENMYHVKWPDGRSWIVAAARGRVVEVPDVVAAEVTLTYPVSMKVSVAVCIAEGAHASAAKGFHSVAHRLFTIAGDAYVAAGEVGMAENAYRAAGIHLSLHGEGAV